MPKTYEVTENEKEQFIVETGTVQTNRTYQKQWLIEEIARLQAILNEFPK